MAAAAAAPLNVGANHAVPLPPSSDIFAAGSVALITGANKSIGFEVARGLAKKGITTLIGARNEELGQAAVKTLHDEGLKTVEFLLIDVTKPDSVAAAVKTVEQKHGKLDILVNNAGILGELKWHSNIEEQPVDNFRTVYETNVFSVYAVTQAFLPLLKLSKHPRVVNVSSGLGSIGLQRKPPQEAYNILCYAYASSKSALNSITVLLSRDLARIGALVNSADPGYCATDFNHHSGYRTAAQGAVPIVHLATLADNGPTGSYFCDEGELPW